MRNADGADGAELVAEGGNLSQPRLINATRNKLKYKYLKYFESLINLCLSVRVCVYRFVYMQLAKYRNPGILYIALYKKNDAYYNMFGHNQSTCRHI